MAEKPKRRYRVVHGDALEVLRRLPDNRFHSVVTDPPAGISFLPAKWDSAKGGRKQWIGWLTEILRECHRVLKPGGYALVWAIPRTSHWTMTAIEWSGFQVKDIVTHLFGVGFPKSSTIAKQIDKRRVDAEEIVSWLKGLGSREEVAKASGVTPRQVDHWLGENTPCPQIPTAERFARICAEFDAVPAWAEKVYPKLGDVVGKIRHARSGGQDFAKRPGSKSQSREEEIRSIGTEEAEPWAGYGTALKPAAEFWILVQKPISEPTIAANVLKHGVGGLNIDGCRVRADWKAEYPESWFKSGKGKGKPWHGSSYEEAKPVGERLSTKGRWPANLVLSHDPLCREVGTMKVKTGTAVRKNSKGESQDIIFGELKRMTGPDTTFAGEGGNEAIPLFACVPSCAVRQLDFPGATVSRFFYCSKSSKKDRNFGLDPGEVNGHPTVKSIKLCRYLCRLITPPNGKVLDPFAGSGSIGVAALLEGFRYYGIEQDESYAKIAKKRVRAADMLHKEVPK